MKEEKAAKPAVKKVVAPKEEKPVEHNDPTGLIEQNLAVAGLLKKKD